MRRGACESPLIPTEKAILPHLALGSAAQALRDELAVRVTVSGASPLEVSAFFHRLLAAFCQDGTPTGLALRPGVAQIGVWLGLRRPAVLAAPGKLPPEGRGELVGRGPAHVFVGHGGMAGGRADGDGMIRCTWPMNHWQPVGEPRRAGFLPAI